jgi:hypothetical protein
MNDARRSRDGRRSSGRTPGWTLLKCGLTCWSRLEAWLPLAHGLGGGGFAARGFAAQAAPTAWERLELRRMGKTSVTYLKKIDIGGNRSSHATSPLAMRSPSPPVALVRLV